MRTGTAAAVKMQADDVDIGPLAVQQRMDSALAGVPNKFKGAAQFNAVWKEGLYRVFDDERGPPSNGPPFAEPTGLGWDTSTEPKNKADMIELAKKLNPVVGFWGARRHHTPPRPSSLAKWLARGLLLHS